MAWRLAPRSISRSISPPAAVRQKWKLALRVCQLFAPQQVLEDEAFPAGAADRVAASWSGSPMSSRWWSMPLSRR
jgi:hypothetical protein